MSNAALAHRPIRIVLAGIPGLTADLVRRCVRGQSDIAIVREFRHADDLSQITSAELFDVVVTAVTANGIPNLCQQLLFRSPGVRIIAVGSDGRLEIYDRRLLREAALDELLAEIRRVGPAAVPRR